MSLTTDAVQKDRPPYIEFSVEAVALQRRAEDGGGLYYEDRDFVLIMPRGGKDVVKKEVKDWFDVIDMQLRMERLDPEWHRQYKGAYAQWKAGMEMPVNGTPLVMWPLLTPAEVKMLKELRMQTVEDVAAANEEALKRMGMGARGLKTKAQDWIKASTDTAPLVERLNALAVSQEAMTKRLADVEEENKALRLAALARAQTPVAGVGTLRPLEDRLHDAQSRTAEIDVDTLVQRL